MADWLAGWLTGQLACWLAQLAGPAGPACTPAGQLRPWAALGRLGATGKVWAVLAGAPWAVEGPDLSLDPVMVKWATRIL